MAKIFLDVGGYEGDASAAALDPIFGFDLVYCFEPVTSNCDKIRQSLTEPRLKIVEAGLFDTVGPMPLAEAGELGASIYQNEGATISCNFIKASDFFRDHISSSDDVWMKLNCEGAEVAIINDLMDTGEAAKLREVLLDLDAVKIPSLYDKAAALVSRLENAPFCFHYPPEVQYGMINNYGGIRNWLYMSGAATFSFHAFFASLIYQLPYLRSSRFNGYYKILVLRALRLRPPAMLVSADMRHTWSPLSKPRGPYHNYAD
jgi:FkbM family methyltransferase